jgi:adhesin transport system membrane fusion protein
MSAHDVHAATLGDDVLGRDRMPRAIRLTVYFIVLLFAVAGYWVSVAKLDVVTRASGRIIASSLSQVVQSLEGGIVREILVREGDVVEEGQVVARIDDTRFSADLGEMTVKRQVLLARIPRLSAELRGLPDIVPPTHEIPPDLLDMERDLMRRRRTELEQSISVLQSQIRQRVAERRELETRRERASALIGLAEQEQSILAPLVRTGAVPRLELLRLQRDIAGLRGDLDITRSSLVRSEEALIEIEQRIEEKQATFWSGVQRELNESEAQLSTLDETMRAAADRVRRAQVRSPVRGVVNKLDLTTRGSVLQPGRTLMEITPLEDVLLVELRVQPQDIAFLRPGLPANVKLTAYDFAQYGAMKGTVAQIGADTIPDEKGVTFYRVIVKTSIDTLKHKDHELTVIPGMIADADIIIGDRTFLDYLLKPLLRASGEVFRER